MPEPSPPAPTQARFNSTQWSLVLAAGGSSSSAGRDALEELCRAYWSPLYAFARRAGHSPADARDHTQGFFAHLLAGAGLSTASPDRGRFRSFLLGAFKHFLAHERDRQNALKRGGGVEWVPLDFSAEEAALAGQSETGDRPDSAYDRRWVAALLEQVLVRLRAEIARTVDHPDRVDEELRHLRAIVRGED